MERDEAVYLRVLSGDRQALAMLVDRYYAQLLAFLIRVTGQRQTAEDLVQETFIRLLRYRGAAPADFRPWVYQIAHNLVRDHFRSAHMWREVQSRPDEDPEKDTWAGRNDVEDVAIQADDNCEVIALLQSLPVQQREVLVLRFYHELSLDEIAEVIGAPLGTVKSRLYTGLRAAREILERDEVKQDERK